MNMEITFQYGDGQIIKRKVNFNDNMKQILEEHKLNYGGGHELYFLYHGSVLGPNLHNETVYEIAGQTDRESRAMKIIVNRDYLNTVNSHANIMNNPNPSNLINVTNHQNFNAPLKNNALGVNSILNINNNNNFMNLNNNNNIMNFNNNNNIMNFNNNNNFMNFNNNNFINLNNNINFMKLNNNNNFMNFDYIQSINNDNLDQANYSDNLLDDEEEEIGNFGQNDINANENINANNSQNQVLVQQNNGQDDIYAFKKCCLIKNFLIILIQFFFIALVSLLSIFFFS